ncbi:MAG TPA: hypothetical protein VE842_19220 [Pyrinomonadaceae bacterium]|nr:hypothetical protein [Pyrinomonadaceae bacterium]
MRYGNVSAGVKGEPGSNYAHTMQIHRTALANTLSTGTIGEVV